MQRTGIVSGTLVSVGYEAATSILELELVSGEIVQYFHVPLTTYIGLMNAGSKGDFYSHNIKAGYESKRVVQIVGKPDNEPV